MNWFEAYKWAEHLGGCWGLASENQLRELFKNEEAANSLRQKSQGQAIWSKDIRDSNAWIFQLDRKNHGYRKLSDERDKRAFAVRDRK